MYKLVHLAFSSCLYLIQKLKKTKAFLKVSHSNAQSNELITAGAKLQLKKKTQENNFCGFFVYILEIISGSFLMDMVNFSMQTTKHYSIGLE